jgi:hypothetical protein
MFQKKLKNGRNPMKGKTLLGALLLVGCVVAFGIVAAEDVAFGQMRSDIDPGSDTSQGNSTLSSLALALSSGKEAMRSFRASQSPVAQTCVGGFAILGLGESQNVYLDTHSRGLPCATGQSDNSDKKNTLNPPIAGIECDIDRIASYISCYSSRTAADEAETLFTRLVDELRAALPSDRWKGMNMAPGVASIRSYTYLDQASNAHIDIDIIGLPGREAQSSYIVSIFGWPN